MRARLHPKGQLLAASPALHAVAWPLSKAQIGALLSAMFLGLVPDQDGRIAGCDDVADPGNADRRYSSDQDWPSVSLNALLRDGAEAAFFTARSGHERVLRGVEELIVPS